MSDKVAILKDLAPAFVLIGCIVAVIVLIITLPIPREKKRERPWER